MMVIKRHLRAGESRAALSLSRNALFDAWREGLEGETFYNEWNVSFNAGYRPRYAG